MKSRALRRHHQQRMQSRVASYYGGWPRGNPRHVGKVARTRQGCSCWMCGNPRRYLGEPTLQERRAWAGTRPRAEAAV